MKKRTPDKNGKIHSKEDFGCAGVNVEGGGGGGGVFSVCHVNLVRTGFLGKSDRPSS